MINSKNKGSTFERKVTKALSTWSGHQFNRVPLSGALRWETNDKRVVSDVVPPPSLKWPFSIEAKNVEYDWDMSTLLSGTSMFWKHWDQASTDAEREEMTPMLVYTKNYRSMYCAVYETTLKKLESLSHSCEITTIIAHSNKYEPVVIMNFDEFLSSYNLDDIQKLC